MTTLRNNQLSKINATCEIYTAAFILKSKLMYMYYVHHHETNFSVKAARLIDNVLIYLDIIITIQWQIYVRMHNKYIPLQLFIFILFILLGPTVNQF